MIVVIHVCAKDSDLVLKNLAWLKKLRQRPEFEAVISHESTFDVKEIVAAASDLFKAVAEIRYDPYPKDADQEWPRPQNWAWQSTARAISKLNANAWLWWEADAVPIKADWLQQLNFRYVQENKPFLGYYVNGTHNYMAGVGIYPATTSRYLRDAFLTSRAPFDVMAGKEIGLESITKANDLIYHIPHLRASKHFYNRESVDDIIPPSTVLFHPCKDGSLIDALSGKRGTKPKDQAEWFPAPTKRTARFYHSGDHGDIIYSLLAAKLLGGGQYFLGSEMKVDPKFALTRARMTQTHCEQIAPLIRSQPYITGCEYAPLSMPQVDYDFNQFRPFFWSSKRDATMLSHGCRKPFSLARAQASLFGLKHIDETEPWLTVEPEFSDYPVVINRTSRYQNDIFDWKAVVKFYGKKLLFVGLRDEHFVFEGQFGRVEYCPSSNLYDLARVISGCELFIGNQSLPYAIAEGLKKPTILEARGDVEEGRDCYFNRPTAIYGWKEMPKLPALRKPLDLNIYPDNFTGLGQVSVAIARELMKRGHTVKMHSLRGTPAHLHYPYDLMARLWQRPLRAALSKPEPGLTICAPFEPNIPKDGVLLTMWESTEIKPEWVKVLNTQKHIVVPTTWNKECFEKCGVEVPISVVPLFISPVFRQYKPFPKGPFTFGTGGRILHGNRKGIKECIEAFREAFPGEDNSVRLLIKISPDDPPPDTKKDARIAIVRSELTEDEMVQFYASLHCYVALSSGEGWGLMPLQAMGVGRTVIAPDFSGFTGFMRYGCVIPHEEVPGTGDYKGLGNMAKVKIDEAAAFLKATRFDLSHAEEVGFFAHSKARDFTVERTVNGLLEALE